MSDLTHHKSYVLVLTCVTELLKRLVYMIDYIIVIFYCQCLCDILQLLGF